MWAGASGALTGDDEGQLRALQFTVIPSAIVDVDFRQMSANLAECEPTPMVRMGLWEPLTGWELRLQSNAQRQGLGRSAQLISIREVWNHACRSLSLRPSSA